MSGHELDAPPWSRVEGTLMSTARAVRRAYDLVFRELSLNLSEASVLAHLADAGALTQVDLARRIGAARARIGVHVDALEARQAVRRDADPNDRRVWLVSLTEEGRALWQRSVELDGELRQRLRVGTTKAERAQLDSLLLRIQRNVNSIATPADE